MENESPTSFEFRVGREVGLHGKGVIVEASNQIINYLERYHKVKVSETGMLAFKDAFICPVGKTAEVQAKLDAKSVEGTS